MHKHVLWKRPDHAALRDASWESGWRMWLLLSTQPEFYLSGSSRSNYIGWCWVLDFWVWYSLEGLDGIGCCNSQWTTLSQMCSSGPGGRSPCEGLEQWQSCLTKSWISQHPCFWMTELFKNASLMPNLLPIIREPVFGNVENVSINLLIYLFILYLIIFLILYSITSSILKLFMCSFV